MLGRQELSSFLGANRRDCSTQGAFEWRWRRVPRPWQHRGRSRLLSAVSGLLGGAGSGAQIHRCQRRDFFKLVPRTYPWNPHVTARAKHAKVQMRLGVTLELTLETRARNKRRERNGGNGGLERGWIGRAFGVEITGEYSGFTPRALRCRPSRGWGGWTIGKLVRDRALVCIFAESGGISISCAIRIFISAYSIISANVVVRGMVLRPVPITQSSTH